MHFMHDACAMAAGWQLDLCPAYLVGLVFCRFTMPVRAEDELTVNCNNLMRLASADTNSSDATPATGPDPAADWKILSSSLSCAC